MAAVRGVVMEQKTPETFKLLSSVASLTFAGLAIFTDQTTECLLAAIVVYMWGRYD